MSTKKPQILEIFMPSEGVLPDVAALDGFIESHGIELVHYQSMPCPLGVTDLHDSRSHAHHSNCSNGLIYEEAGVCTSMFSGNSSSSMLEQAGIIDGSTVQVTLPRFYDGTQTPVEVQSMDRFYLKDFAGARTTSQRFEHSQGETDRLDFPILTVKALMGADGVTYKQDQDFAVRDGVIVWGNKKQPAYDPKSERGEICSVRYSYRPYFYVKTLLHDVRVTKSVNPQTGETSVVRLPYAVLLSREYVPLNEINDDERPDMRDVRGPRHGGFGPR